MTLGLLCLALFLPGFSAIPPVDRDEPLFAQATRQMVDDGDYFDIRFQDRPRYQKPIGIYWLQAAALRLAGEDKAGEIWVYRLPSLAGATAAVVMTAATGSLLFGPMAGLLAAIMLASCLLLNVEARLAKTDAALLACAMFAYYALAKAYMGEKLSFGLRLAFWTAEGAALLIKGPVLSLITVATLAALRIKQGNLEWFAALRPKSGAAWTLAMAAPWFVTIALQSGGDFIAASAGSDFLAKIWQGQNRGIIPPGAHMAMMLPLLFPASLLVLLAIPDTWRDRDDRAVAFCLAWLVPAWIMFELPLTKLPHYTLPLYPALTMLAARAALRGFPALAGTEERNGGEEIPRTWTQRFLPPLAFGAWSATGAGLAVAALSLPIALGGTWRAASLSIGVAVMIIIPAAAWLLLKRRAADAVVVLCAGAIIAAAGTFGHLLPATESLWMSRRIERLAQSVKPCSKLKLVTASYAEPGLVFLAGRSTLSEISGRAAAEDMAWDKCIVAAVDDKRRDDFLDTSRLLGQHSLEVARLGGFSLGKMRGKELTFYVSSNKRTEKSDEGKK